MVAARFRPLALAIGLVGLLAGASAWASPVAASDSYFLPVQDGTHVVVTQGNGGGHTGKEKFAFDFALAGDPEFPVVAARAGTVIGLEAGYKTSQHCGNDSCWTLANYVLVDQGDNTSALYLHLAEGSLKVVLGQKVTQGQTLGDADCTGWSTANHLHFQVEQTPSSKVLDQAKAGKAADGWWFTQSVSITFSDPSVLAQDPNGIPTAGGVYVSSNGASQAPVASPSSLRATSKPGGMWISPDDSSQQVGSMHLSAHAYPSKPSDPAIDHVSFTVWWSALGAKSGPWKTACTVKSPTSGDTYECDFNPGDLGAPAGQLWLSFDVYDKSGGSNLSPNGERSVDWLGEPDVAVSDWQTYEGGFYSVDYPDAPHTMTLGSSDLRGLDPTVGSSVSYYYEGSETAPRLVYFVADCMLARTNGDYDLQGLVHRIIPSYNVSGVTASSADITISGWGSADVMTVSGNGIEGTLAILHNGGEQVVIGAVHQTGDSRLDSKRFFDSFKYAE